MKHMLFAMMFCFLFAAFFLADAFAQSSAPKIMPYSMGYPLIRRNPFPNPLRDQYQALFGVRRVVRANIPGDVTRVSEELLKYHDAYGGYGVLGHGEDVFTTRAARFRENHRGR